VYLISLQVQFFQEQEKSLSEVLGIQHVDVRGNVQSLILAEEQRPTIEKAREEAERKEKEEKGYGWHEHGWRYGNTRESFERKAKESEEEVGRLAREAEERKLKAREEAGLKAREEAERTAREREEAERKAREEAERKAREEADRLAREREEAERKAREEAERKAREEAERKAREEAERLAREEAERKLREAQAAEKAKEQVEATTKRLVELAEECKKISVPEASPLLSVSSWATPAKTATPKSTFVDNVAEPLPQDFIDLGHIAPVPQVTENFAFFRSSRDFSPRAFSLGFLSLPR
jgi:hypothetical protein